jgi:hypothetical protein
MLVALATVMVTSCSSIAPVKVNAGDQCFRCRRTILDSRLAGEVIDGNGFVAKFKAPLCMAKYLVAHPEETGTVYVTDAVTGKMVPPESALFVPIVVNRDTGERDYAAYRYGADAEHAALGANTVPRTWAAVREAAGE